MRKNIKGFTTTKIILTFAAVLILVIAGWYMWSHRQMKASGDIQPDFSPNRTLQENNGTLVIDFAKCSQDIRRFDVAFGSTTIEIQGKHKDSCELAYGGEVENPNWDGKLATTCKVPTSLGQKEFTKGQNGVDLSPIQQYCSS